MTIERRNVGPRLSDLVIYAPPPAGRLVRLAGQVAEDPAADIAGQTRSVQGETPARATVQAQLANPAHRVEIQLVAAAG